MYAHEAPASATTTPDLTARPVSRRGFLALAAGMGAATLSGCGGNGSAPPAASGTGGTDATGNTATGNTATGDTGSAATPATSPVGPGPGTGLTVPQLFNLPRFYIAHRGGSASFPEMTFAAYQASVAAGMLALEVSVHRSKDGVFVCCHDPNTKAATGVDMEIAGSTWAQLSKLKVRARKPDGPIPQAPLTRLETVLQAYGGSKVIFLEDKTQKHADALLALVARYPHPERHFVWKVSGVADPGIVRAGKAAGLTSWGYWFAADMKRFAATHGPYDTLGLDYRCSATDAAAMRATRKLLIGHIVSIRRQIDKVIADGCRGLMLARIERDLMATPSPR